jgi:hypothetical protein
LGNSDSRNLKDGPTSANSGQLNINEDQSILRRQSLPSSSSAACNADDFGVISFLTEIPRIAAGGKSPFGKPSILSASLRFDVEIITELLRFDGGTVFTEQRSGIGYPDCGCHFVNVLFTTSRSILRQKSNGKMSLRHQSHLVNRNSPFRLRGRIQAWLDSSSNLKIPTCT